VLQGMAKLMEQRLHLPEGHQAGLVPNWFGL
jgi:hypothetical protein